MINNNKICIETKIIELLFKDDEFYRSVISNKKISAQRFPRTDQWCDDEGFHLAFALAGFSPNDINVSVVNNTLNVSSTRRSDNSLDSVPARKQVEKGVIVRGIARRTFQRSYFIFHEFDVDEATASMKNGLLEILIPKRAPAESKVIKIGE